MTDTTPAAALDLDAIRERYARAERFGGVALRAEVCADVPGMLAEIERLRVQASNYAHGRDEARRERDEIQRSLAAADAHRDAHAYEVRLICDALEIDVPATADPIIEAVAALRRELAEARAETESLRADFNGACEQIAHMHAAAVGEVRGPIRGVVEDVKDIRRERDEAVAETERVRTVYRDTQDRLRNALEVTAAIWDAEAERLIEVRDKSGDRAKRLRVEAVAHAYRACHHALLAVLTSPLDGAATTSPETAPAYDLGEGVLDYAEDVQAYLRGSAVPPTTQEPTPKDGTP